MSIAIRRPFLVLRTLALVLAARAGCSDSGGAVTTVELAEGDVRESFEFEAEDPATHAFDVEIEMPEGT